MIKLISTAYAADQVVDIGQQVSQNNFFGYTCIWNLISNIISVAFIVGAVATFVFLVLGGMNWLTSSGDKTKVEAAQKMISNALIGLAIIAASWAVYTIVLEFFGIDLSSLCSNNPVGG